MQLLEGNRFKEWMNAVCPVDSVSIGTVGTLSTYTYTPSSSATQQQIADAVVQKLAFDPSQAGYDAWIIENKKKDAKNKILGGEAEERLIRALVDVIRDEINTLRTLAILGLSTRTLNQLQTAIRNKIDSDN